MSLVSNYFHHRAVSIASQKLMPICVAGQKRSIAFHKCVSNTFVIVRSAHPADHHNVGWSAKARSKKNSCTAKECLWTSFVGDWILIVYDQLWHLLGVPSLDMHQQFPALLSWFLLLFISNFPLISIMPSKSTDFGTGADVSGITKTHVSADQPAPIPPYLHRHIFLYQLPTSVTSHFWKQHTNPLKGNNCLRAIVHDQKAWSSKRPLASDMHVSVARYPKLNVTWYVL